MGPPLEVKQTQTNTIGALEDRLAEWLEWDKNPHTHAAIKALSDEKNADMLQKLLLGRMDFGTAGLRGQMGPGYTQMNDLVIIQTTQGIASYLEQTNDEKANKEGGVVIGYDGRHNSKRFAELTAGIFLNKGFTVHLFSEVCPTPFVPFCVNLRKCVAGVMITASHNPKEDNGYKVYWNNGAQIIPPHDKLIQVEILKNLPPWDNAWDTSILATSVLLKDPIAEVMGVYYTILRDNIVDQEVNEACTVKVTYTAMHGVGYRYMKAAFHAGNFKKFVSVKQQRDPDPDFPTVKFPNPEEGKSALDLSILTAEENGSYLILANDPDADRLAAAERNPRTNKWHIFTGNELGALLGWWTLQRFHRRNVHPDLSKVYMLASTVSTKFLQSMAKVEGFNFVETLTGFKWMGNRAVELMAEGGTVLFAFEEAIGFMCGTAVLDKDGISAGAYTAELVAYLQTQCMTLEDQLEALYAQYGHHITRNSYFLCHEPEVLKKLFDQLRTFQGGPDTYPQSICEGKYCISGVRDLTTGYDSSQPDLKAILPTSSSSQMITFTFENGLVATLRTSGTEPKVKYYTELCASPEQTNLQELNDTLDEMVAAIINEFLLPDINGLLPRTA